VDASSLAPARVIVFRPLRTEMRELVQLRNRFQGSADPSCPPARTLALVFANDRAFNGQQNEKPMLGRGNKRHQAPML
jgi:hypothetical protein